MEAEIDRTQAFELIDQVLPFEACLYHEFLPLALHEGELYLGMVNLTDFAALDYARHMVSCRGYRLVTQTIAIQSHRLYLSTYLNQKPQANGPAEDLPSTTDPGGKSPDNTAVDRSTLLLDDSAGLEAEPSSEQKALVFDGDETPPGWQPSQAGATGLQLGRIPAVAQSGAQQPGAQQRTAQSLPALTNKTIDRETRIHPTPPWQVPRAMPITPMKLSVPGEFLPQLKISPQAVSAFHPQLQTLPLPQLMQVLLLSILDSGVGRLYFERQGQAGRVFWSKNGEVEAVLSDLPAQQFQALIDELKTLVSMSCSATNKPAIAEVERLYQNQRILLRLQILPRVDGEDATLQVLRGSALKFHQQHQLTALSRSAIQIARQLYQKMHELQVQTQSVQTQSVQTQSVQTQSVESSYLSTASLALKIDQVIYTMEQEMDRLRQLKASLRASQTHDPSTDSP
jgi:type II secretory ATPase GspE/PulE/Tfp pilus assembly ATPase PilB-like protein